MKLIKIFLSCIVPATCFLLTLSACNRMPESNGADGERWFKLNRCVGCHGKKGSGGRGPVIAGTSLGYNRFLRKLRNPRSAIMPTFTPQQVPDQDAADIYVWLLQQKK